jgi:RNA polymerase sigma factor (sigma-70 family)
MNRESELVENHLGLAQVITCEYSNIPAATLDEIRAEAQKALAAAARHFEPGKGQFAPYAARAIRNALNSLYEKQLRYVQVHEFSLDAPGHATSGTTESSLVSHIADGSQDMAVEIRARESRKVLEEVLAALPKRSRRALEMLRESSSYAEIGAAMAISKQAAHKIGQDALHSLRAKLEARGFAGLDSKGFLKSCSGKSPPAG